MRNRNQASPGEVVLPPGILQEKRGDFILQPQPLLVFQGMHHAGPRSMVEKKGAATGEGRWRLEAGRTTGENVHPSMEGNATAGAVRFLD